MNAMSPLRFPEGIHRGIPEAVYHADCAEQPSASSSILRALDTKSADHARYAHPRLNPSRVSKPGTDAQNWGTVLHSLTLETPPVHAIINVTDYKTVAARQMRDAAIAEGLIPIKAGDMTELDDVAASIRARLHALPEVWAAMQDAISNRMSEATLIWRERGVLCRCRYDTLPDARFGATYDLKFTGRSAEPDDFGKKVTGDYAMQADLYPRAVKALRGDRPLFVFLAAETDPPFGVSLHALDPEAALATQEKVDGALDVWGYCLRENVWPSYPSLIHYHAMKPWQMNDWENKRAARKYVREFSKRPNQGAIDRYNELMIETGARA